MKTTLTWKHSLLVLIAVFFCISVHGQTKHIVEVSGSKFTPKNLTISVGDTVEWHNLEGSHNVNGTTTTYPSNPESFGNSIGIGWTYSHKFMTSGNYDYRCDQHFAFGMVGTVTVEAATSINYDVLSNSTKIFPNPAKEKLNIEPQGFESTPVLVEIYNIAGKIEFSNLYTSEKRMEVNVEQLNKGIYFVKLSDKNTVQVIKLIKN